MTLEYTIDGKVQVKMINYIDSMLEPLPSSMGGETAMLADNNLFTVIPNYSLLSKSGSESFHYYVAKNFLCK